MTHLLCTSLTPIDNEIFFAQAQEKFSKEFVLKYSKYKRWQDAKSTILGRLLLAYGLQKFYNINVDDIAIEYSKDKRPFLENSEVQFNISHSNDFIVCAFTSHGGIGVDVEKISNVDINDFRSQFSKSEYDNMVGSLHVQEKFFEFWTQKEAVLKAYGTGLNVALDSIEIIDGSSTIGEEVFYLEEIDLTAEYKCHIATQHLNEFSSTEITHVSPEKIADFMGSNFFKTIR